MNTQKLDTEGVADTKTKVAELNFEILGMYVDSAKSFVQLSSGGVALPLAFKNALSALWTTNSRFNTYALAFVGFSWLFFLLSIICGAIYQYAAAKYFENATLPAEAFIPWGLKRMTNAEPGLAYGAMVICFLLGVFFVVLYSVVALFVHG